MWSLSVYSEDGELLQSSFEVAAGKVQFWICGFYSLREQHSRVFVIPSDSVYCVSLVQRRHVFIACWLLWSFSSRFTRRPSQTWTNESRRETGCLSEMLPRFLGAQLALVLPAWLAHESTFVVSLLWHFHVSKYRRHVHCHFCFAPCSKFGKSTELPLPTFRFLEPFPLFTPIVAYTKHMTLWKKNGKKKRSRSLPLQLWRPKLGGEGMRCGNAKQGQNLKICLKIFQVGQTTPQLCSTCNLFGLC